MECYVGIDLGSTTTKAVYLDAAGKILGRGITNSRSNYFVACQVAREEAEINARFHVLKENFKSKSALGDSTDELMAWLSSKFHLAQHRKQMAALEKACMEGLNLRQELAASRTAFATALEEVFAELEAMAEDLFKPGAISQSNFFRDIATSLFLKQAEAAGKRHAISFDRLVGIFDKAILQVENQSFSVFYADYLDFARQETVKNPQFTKDSAAISDAVNATIALTFDVTSTVGTGYGRLTLPFPKEQIRSEILCHGLGAHAMFPLTRTVLDIGGQDTKAIQIDEHGIVTSFQMNDRCAAGCGRYLGYIADEMNMGVHQLGPLAMLSTKPVRINSTCTVFAGAELRERLSLGEKREDILAGLHRAIVLRAMSLLSRSGGVVSEFTFTGGVARNEAATGALRKLVKENYGDVTMNISADSIFTGALGAALYATRDQRS